MSLLLLLLPLLSGSARVQSAQLEPSSPKCFVVAADRAQASHARIARSEDFQGCLIEGHGRTPMQIIELQWGLNGNMELVPAYFRGYTRDGELVVDDQRAHVAHVFSNLQNMQGFYCFRNRKRIWAEDFAFGITSDGFVTIDLLRGIDDKGRSVSEDHSAAAPQVQACRCHSTLHCTAGTCSNPTNCTNSTYPNCNCGAVGNCGTGGTCDCPVEAPCPPGKTCLINSDASACSCQ